MKIVSSKALAARQFKTLEFEGLWAQLFGQPEQGFKMLVYGPEKSGKSTLALRFAAYLASFGKVLYNSHEEGISKTFQDRLESNSINSDRLFVGHKVSFDELMSDAFKRKYFKFIVIDSLQYMSLSYVEYKSLIARYPRKSIILISQANGRGRIKGGTDLAHAVDIKVHIVNGRAKVQSRFAPEQTLQVFDQKQSQLTLKL